MRMEDRVEADPDGPNRSRRWGAAGAVAAGVALVAVLALVGLGRSGRDDGPSQEPERAAAESETPPDGEPDAADDQVQAPGAGEEQPRTQPQPDESPEPTSLVQRRSESESAGEAPPGEPNCDPNYEGTCVPPDATGVTCESLGEYDFPVIGGDPHNLDPDVDGVACESEGEFTEPRGDPGPAQPWPG
jgi:hypothetical protein